MCSTLSAAAVIHVVRADLITINICLCAIYCMYKHSCLGLMVFLTGPGSISRVPHDSDEFSKVVEKFRKDWAWEKRPYPAVNFIFKVTNNMLEQKWMGLQGDSSREGCQGTLPWNETFLQNHYCLETL